MQKTLEQILAEVFGVGINEITDQTSPDNLAAWDSFNGLKLVQTLEEYYKIKFDIEEMARTRNVGDIKKLLQKYRAP